MRSPFNPEQKLIKLTAKLVALQTYHPNFAEKRACLDFIKNLVKNDLRIQEFEFNGFSSLLLSTGNISEMHFNLLLAGHIDVVSAPEAMFKMTQHDGKLFGRGVYDMKGSVAVMLLALQQYAKLQTKSYKLKAGLLLTSDEELDGQNGTKAVLEKTNLTADFALLPDNGDHWEIMLAERGLLHVRLDPRTKDATIKALSEHFPLRGNENTEWITTFTVNTSDLPAEASAKVGVSPELGSVDIRVRFASPEDEQKALEILNQAQVIRRHNGASTPEENPHVKRLQHIIQAQTGSPAHCTKECRTNESDAIYFAEHNIPAALVRPFGGGMHKNDEWLDQDALEKFGHIMQNLLDEYA